MNIFSAKYKAHRLVNYIFYIIIFAFGFLIGIGAKKLDFKSIISKVFMIDTVNATTIYTYNNNTVNEDFIYNRFLDIKSDFSFDVFQYVYCGIYSRNAYSSNPGLACNAFRSEFLSPNYLKFY